MWGGSRSEGYPQLLSIQIKSALTVVRHPAKKSQKIGLFFEVRRISKNSNMITYDNNTKYWSLTWETNIFQKTIPDEHELLCFLRKHCSDAIFQYEKGTLKEKLHIQGRLPVQDLERAR